MMKRSIFTSLLCVFLWLCATPAAAVPGIPQDDTAAVIFVYHRIGEDEYPYTSIRKEQFASHIRELVEGGYNIAALPDVVAAMKSGAKLPPRTVVLTFDGGHQSVLDNAVPLLIRHELPFTLFVSTDHIDRATNQYMDWDDLRRLSRHDNISFGLHPAAYIRLYNAPEEEALRQINKARARFREEMKAEAAFFAYPFGEYSQAYRDLIEAQGFTAAFGQQSGVAYAGSDIMALPRFPMTESYGGLDRFRLTATALPLPVTGVEPADPLLKTAEPAIGFTIEDTEGLLEGNLSCFASGQGKPDLEIVGKNRVELRLEKPFDEERARINCTIPLPTGDNYEEPRWRWFGLLLVAPQKNAGAWPTGTNQIDTDG